jgi:uncharacterized protein (TIGR00730 family)
MAAETHEHKGPPPDLQLSSPAYRLAFADQDFLLGDSMRGVRFMLEYEKAEEALRAWGISSTIVVFGSARVRENGAGDHARWYQAAREFASLCSREAGALAPLGTQRHNVIATGGGPGIMEAANRGAFEVGAPSIGFNITLPHEQWPNAYTTPELTFQFHYFAIRKMHLAMRARALVVFPGGYGTFDELFEVLNLRCTGKSPDLPIILFDSDYWSRAVNFDVMLDAGVINAHDLTLFQYADSVDDILYAIKAYKNGALHVVP